jgi:hypothetical protein
MPNLTAPDKEILAKIYRNTIIGSGVSDKGWDSSKSYYLNDFEIMLESLKNKGYDIVKSSKTENLDKKSKAVKSNVV